MAIPLIPPRQIRGTQFDSYESMPAIFPLADSTVKVAVGAAHAESAAINAAVVRLLSTTNCYVTFGPAPIADATKMYLPANNPEYFQFNPGEFISVIQDAAGGNLFITPAA